MIGTESRLWEVLKASVARFPGRFTRIESGTVDGISDVEYILPPWHGWIELKTLHWPRKGRPFSLHCPFTLSQCSWLLDHHRPADNLRSWLLLGVVGPRTWARFILIRAPLTTHLLEIRQGPPHEWLLGLDGVRDSRQMSGVIATLRGHRENP